jgi:hypothetical protein
VNGRVLLVLELERLAGVRYYGFPATESSLEQYASTWIEALERMSALVGFSRFDVAVFLSWGTFASTAEERDFEALFSGRASVAGDYLGPGSSKIARKARVDQERGILGMVGTSEVFSYFYDWTATA